MGSTEGCSSEEASAGNELFGPVASSATGSAPVFISLMSSFGTAVGLDSSFSRLGTRSSPAAPLREGAQTGRRGESARTDPNLDWPALLEGDDVDLRLL